MTGAPSRRGLIAGAAASLVADAALAAEGFAALEARVGGRLGVAALDLASGAKFAHRADERFPMCSTFKAMAAAAILARVDRGQLGLDTVVRYGPADLMSYAPVTRAHVAEGGMTLADLCAAAVELSDNTAANLILKTLGGPAGWTAFVRTLGDPVSRLDRTETALNTSIPGDPRDTTTPAAMLADLRRTVLGDALAPASRQRLRAWMLACKTGDARLRAGLPPAWRVGDKTGSWAGENAWASSNDIAVAWTATQPILIAAYLTGPDSTPGKARDEALADVGRLVARTFRPAEAAHG